MIIKRYYSRFVTLFLLLWMAIFASFEGENINSRFSQIEIGFKSIPDSI